MKGVVASTLVGMVSVGLAVACGTDAGTGEAAPFFPTYPPSPQGDMNAALLPATIALDGSCIYADSEGERFLILWPEGWSAETDEDLVRIFDDEGAEVATEGQEVGLGGGERTVALAEELSGMDLEDNCGSAKVWITNSVEDLTP